MKVQKGKLVEAARLSPTTRNSESQLQKWGQATVTGFQLVPNVLFKAQKHLELDSNDLVVLLNLTLHWWGPDSLPYPSPSIIAHRMGVSRRTVERRIEALEKRGFLKRLPAWANADGQQQRKFELSGLVEKLEDAAKIGLGQRNFVKSRDRR